MLISYKAQVGRRWNRSSRWVRWNLAVDAGLRSPTARRLERLAWGTLAEEHQKRLAAQAFRQGW